MNIQSTPAIVLPVAIIGGGPVGLAAAAHLAKRKEPFILFETGHSVGVNILDWSHVRVFSPWQYNIDKAAEELLIQSGWQSPDKEALPTGKELVEQYFQPFMNLPQIKPFIHLSSKVISIGRKGLDKMKTKGRENLPFVLQVQQGDSYHLFEARAIIDASGTWQNNNPIGSGGVFAIGEERHRDKLFYGIPDVMGKYKERYSNKRVLVVGGGHSAINTILELDKLKEEYPVTEIHWVLRKKHIKDVYGGKEDDALPARGALGIKIEALVNEDKVSVYTPFQIEEIKGQKEGLMLIGMQNGIRKALRGIDEIISNTGSRPDFSFLQEVRMQADVAIESVPGIAELIDPNIHSCGTVRPHGEAELRQPEKDFYIVGAKSYGRAPTFLMATGYEQVRSVVAALVNDWESALKVELDLPETGVCSVNIEGMEGSGACCGTDQAKKEATVSQSTEAIACCG
jgi:thioredoxin reductase